MTQQMTGGDPIRDYANKLREDAESKQGRSVMVVKKQAVRAAALASRQRGGKSVAVVRGR